MNIYYTKEHEWVKVLDGVGVVGISEYAAHELGDITFVELPKTGIVVTQFKLLASIESVKAASDIFAPVSGSVIKINEELEAKPELVNESPEDAGWVAWIKLVDAGELKKLMTREQYNEYLKNL